MSAIITRVVRNISDSAIKVSLPAGFVKIIAQYRDSGTAGSVRMIFEAASQLDAEHRLSIDSSHLTFASQQPIPAMSFRTSPVIYVRADNAIGAGTNELILQIEVTQ